MKTIHITKMTLEDKSHGCSDCIFSHFYPFRENGEGLDWRTYYKKQKQEVQPTAITDNKSMQVKNTTSMFLLPLNSFAEQHTVIMYVNVPFCMAPQYT